MPVSATIVGCNNLCAVMAQAAGKPVMTCRQMTDLSSKIKKMYCKHLLGFEQVWYSTLRPCMGICKDHRS